MNEPGTVAVVKQIATVSGSFCIDCSMSVEQGVIV